MSNATISNSAATGTAKHANSEDSETEDEEKSAVAESQQKKQKEPARKECPYGGVIATATVQDCVLATKESDKVEVFKGQRTRLISIKGIDIRKIHLNTLRDNAKPRFDIRVSVRRKNKAEICDLIAAKVDAIAVANALLSSSKRNNNDPCAETDDHDAIVLQAHRSPGDYYRLINVLVGERCKLAYAQVGQHTCRAARDSEVSPLEGFKMIVFTEYHSESSDYDAKLYEHIVFDTAQPAIDPSNYSPKTAAQLHSMRMVLERNHNKLMDQMTQSGNHNGFEAYIHGDIKAMYYYLALKENPDIENTVDSHLRGDVVANSIVGKEKKQTKPLKKKKTPNQARDEKLIKSLASLSQAVHAKQVETCAFLIHKKRSDAEASLGNAIEQLRLARKAKKELSPSASQSEEDEADNTITLWKQSVEKWKVEVKGMNVEAESAAENGRPNKQNKQKARPKRKNNGDEKALQDSRSGDDSADDSLM